MNKKEQFLLCTGLLLLALATLAILTGCGGNSWDSDPKLETPASFEGIQRTYEFVANPGDTFIVNCNGEETRVFVRANIQGARVGIYEPGKGGK